MNPQEKLLGVRNDLRSRFLGGVASGASVRAREDLGPAGQESVVTRRTAAVGMVSCGVCRTGEQCGVGKPRGCPTCAALGDVHANGLVPGGTTMRLRERWPQRRHFRCGTCPAGQTATTGIAAASRALPRLCGPTESIECGQAGGTNAATRSTVSACPADAGNRASPW